MAPSKLHQIIFESKDKKVTLILNSGYTFSGNVVDVSASTCKGVRKPGVVIVEGPLATTYVDAEAIIGITFYNKEKKDDEEA